jgi:hypothetical protein
MQSLEETLGLPPPTSHHTKQALKQPPNTPHPPSKIDILIDLMDEIKHLKQIREDVITGQRAADEILKAEMYITQLQLSAYKIILEGLKENNVNLTQNNYTQIDISAQVNDLIQFSRERQCLKNKPMATS